MNGKESLSGRRISYVTSAWAGLEDVLDKGLKPKGMPAFFHPLHELAERGAQIDLVVLSDSNSSYENVESDYFKNTRVTVLPWPKGKSLKSIVLLFNTLIKLFQHLRGSKPEFIYALGTTGAFGVIIAKMLRVPVGVRIFGINKYYELYKQIGKARFALKSPLLFMLFKLRSKFILATDDGSNADKLNKQIGHRSNKFLFWKNGFDSGYESVQVNEQQPFLLYPSRISDKKQQIKALELIECLNALGEERITLKLVGHITEQAYFDKLMAVAKEKGLDERIEYHGSIEKKQLFGLMRESVAVLSLQKISNLGNTLIETLNCESIALSYNEPALNAFLEDGKSAILVNDVHDAAEEVIDLLNDPESSRAMRVEGKKALYSFFSTWEKRVDDELNEIACVISE